MSKPAGPKPPPDLTPEALAEWKQVCAELKAIDRLEKCDRALLTVYVTTWSVYEAMRKHVDQFGAIVEHANGVAGQSPHYKTSRELAAQLRAMLTDLGLAPIARCKVKAPEKEPADLKF